MTGGTLWRYFGFRFLNAVVAVFLGVLVLVAMVDYIELLRRSSERDVSALFVAQVTLYRLPFLTERILPFSVLTGAMFCYLNLSRRMELVIARAAGMSAWQFVAPALLIAMLIGAAATTLYNPLSAMLREQSTRLEAELFQGGRTFQDSSSGFWVRQRSDEGYSVVLNAQTSRKQGSELDNVTVFRLDEADRFRDRIEAKSATLQAGFWRLEDVRLYSDGAPPVLRDAFNLKTSLTPAQVRESFATPDSLSFWQLSSQVELSEASGLAAAGYRIQYYTLLVQPFYLAAMVLLAAAVSLRLFRFGGVQKMVLFGIGGGFLLYVMSKVTSDMSKAGLMAPLLAAALPAVVGGLTGFIALLYQEEG
jgi:lipopolysaccharide export system permease protein